MLYRLNLCSAGGNMGFSSYVLARYAPDFHTLIYMDGDAIPLASPGQSNIRMQDVIYDRMYSNQMCLDQRFHLIEHQVLEHDSAPQRVTECSIQLTQNETLWNKVLAKCEIAHGNVVARTDSAQSLDVHYIATDAVHLPPGVTICQEGKEFKIPTEHFVELHLTHKHREPVCQCFHVES